MYFKVLTLKSLCLLLNVGVNIYIFSSIRKKAFESVKERVCVAFFFGE
jgi:hypothetical protein